MSQLWSKNLVLDKLKKLLNRYNYVMPCNEHFSSGILEENIRNGDMIMSEFQNDKSRNLPYLAIIICG